MSEADAKGSPSELEELRRAFVEAFRGISESEQVRLALFITEDAPAAIARAGALPTPKKK